MNTELVYVHAWKQAGCSNKQLFWLEKTFDSLEQAWNEQKQQKFPERKSWQEIQVRKKTLNPEIAFEEVQKNNLEIITKNNPEYPPMIAETPDAPYALYIRGKKEVLHNPCVAIVGSRTETRYGENIIERLVPPLVENDLTIVSGLALGTDGHAHRTTLARHGTTIAVLGSGLDDRSLAPASHQSLGRSIIEEGGALVSEYPPGTPGYPGNFPERNRIIAGLAQGVIVTEAREKSGALITARFAAEIGREVCVFPGSVFSETSAGTNALIQKGALLVTNPQDVLLALGLHAQKPTKRKTYSENEKTLLEILSEGPQHIDEIIEKIPLQLGTIMETLTLLEAENIIINPHPLTYQISSNKKIV